MKGIRPLPSSPVILSEVFVRDKRTKTQSKDPFRAGSPSRLQQEFSRTSRVRGPLAATIFFAFLLSALSSAQTLTGTVKHATTGKPAAESDGNQEGDSPYVQHGF